MVQVLFGVPASALFFGAEQWAGAAPIQWNGGTVRRLWAYLVRPKADKTKLKRVLGADLAKDLDNAYKNVYLCMAVEHEALEAFVKDMGVDLGRGDIGMAQKHLDRA